MTIKHITHVSVWIPAPAAMTDTSYEDNPRIPFV